MATESALALKMSLSQGPLGMNDPKPAAPKCEKCRQLMRLKFATLRLSQPGRMLVYECADCEKLAFIPAPPVR
jgi:hypothetical protein